MKTIFSYVFTYCLSQKINFSWRKSLSYRNQSIDLQSKAVDWFLYDRDLRHERVRERNLDVITLCFAKPILQ